MRYFRQIHYSRDISESRMEKMSQIAIRVHFVPVTLMHLEKQ